MLEKRNGITLIALVITIIVLLILAGVALATIFGQGNIIENAENSVGKYNEEVGKEQDILNSIEKFLIEKTDRNGPIVKAKQDNVAVIVEQSNETSDYFEIEQNGSAPITDIIYSVENTKELGVGTHTVTCTVTKSNGKSASASITVIVKEKLEYTKLTYTTPGTYTWTVPEGVRTIKVTIAGAGGGGRRRLSLSRKWKWIRRKRRTWKP